MNALIIAFTICLLFAIGRHVRRASRRADIIRRHAQIAGGMGMAAHAVEQSRERARALARESEWRTSLSK